MGHHTHTVEDKGHKQHVCKASLTSPKSLQRPEGGREGGKESGREGGREGGKERGREREGEVKYCIAKKLTQAKTTFATHPPVPCCLFLLELLSANLTMSGSVESSRVVPFNISIVLSQLSFESSLRPRDHYEIWDLGQV